MNPYKIKFNFIKSNTPRQQRAQAVTSGEKRGATIMETGAILTALRRERGLGQKEMAAYLSLSTGTISNYENGVHSPDLNTLCRLADYFGVTTDYLLGRTDFRYDQKKMCQKVCRDYTLSEVVDVILACDAGSISHLMEYAMFLKTRQETPASEKKPR